MYGHRDREAKGARGARTPLVITSVGNPKALGLGRLMPVALCLKSDQRAPQPDPTDVI